MIHGQAGAMQINICNPGQIEGVYWRCSLTVSPSAAAGPCSDQLTDARRQLQLQLMYSCTPADIQLHPS